MVIKLDRELIEEFKSNTLKLTGLTESQTNHIITILLASEEKLNKNDYKQDCKECKAELENLENYYNDYKSNLTSKCVIH